MYWNWKISGLALAGVFLLAVVLVKPIGVSTQFVIFDGLVASWFNPTLVVEDATSASGYASSNAYLNKSGGKYAEAIANPLNYSFVFVIAMVVGGFLGRRFQSRGQDPVPPFHRARFGQTPAMRYGLAFAGGILVLWGARLAGGCTSGHMMSGMMQTAVSGYLFALAAFAFAVPTALLLYRDGGNT
ncbi:YeeE/YedE thiosulfate transporter family protein [Marinobacter sp. OP 3.4]|uniref:YeeE/YedE thiosulfate transporter family protein n=1 Tax=Marinobacter sp. OP 3.4 TaxID=3076501 RepID=UPI002E1CE8F0